MNVVARQLLPDFRELDSEVDFVLKAKETAEQRHPKLAARVIKGETISAESIKAVARFAWLLMVPISTKTDVADANQAMVRRAALEQYCYRAIARQCRWSLSPVEPRYA